MKRELTGFGPAVEIDTGLLDAIHDVHLQGGKKFAHDEYGCDPALSMVVDAAAEHSARMQKLTPLARELMRQSGIAVPFVMSILTCAPLEMSGNSTHIPHLDTHEQLSSHTYIVSRSLGTQAFVGAMNADVFKHYDDMMSFYGRYNDIGHDDTEIRLKQAAISAFQNHELTLETAPSGAVVEIPRTTLHRAQPPTRDSEPRTYALFLTQ